MAAHTQLIGSTHYTGYSGSERAGPGWANTARWAVNSLWEDHPVNEWTPGLMGSVSCWGRRFPAKAAILHFTFTARLDRFTLLVLQGAAGGTMREQGRECFKTAYCIRRMERGCFLQYIDGAIRCIPIGCCAWSIISGDRLKKNTINAVTLL